MLQHCMTTLVILDGNVQRFHQAKINTINISVVSDGFMLHNEG